MPGSPAPGASVDTIYDAGVQLGVKLLRTAFLADYFVNAAFREGLNNVKARPRWTRSAAVRKSLGSSGAVTLRNLCARCVSFMRFAGGLLPLPSTVINSCHPQVRQREPARNLRPDALPRSDVDRLFLSCPYRCRTTPVSRAVAGRRRADGARGLGRAPGARRVGMEEPLAGARPLRAALAGLARVRRLHGLLVASHGIFKISTSPWRCRSTSCRLNGMAGHCAFENESSWSYANGDAGSLACP